MSTPATLVNVRQLAEQYGEAWNRHDIDAILSMHAHDMIFHLHAPGYAEVSGEAALREQFRLFFMLWPDLEFRTRRLTVADRLFTNEMTMAGTLASPMRFGDTILQPTGKPVTFDAVDVIPVELGRVK